jgi:ribosomal protein S18 acetylase RimI-like enzyme
MQFTIKTTKKSVSMSSPTVNAKSPMTPVTPVTPASYEGLRFEVRENDGGDRLYESCSPISPMSPMSPTTPMSPSDENCILMRSQSSAETDTTTPLPEAEAEPETEAAPKDLNITRLELGENADTHALLHFLTSQGINTTRLVTEHLTKYGSRVRIAKTDDGKLIGCLIFDNETDQSELHGMTPEEAKKQVGPFIYMQMLVVAPEHAADADKHWRERLVTSFLECVVKNGKIAIVRADADNQPNIQMYQSCGFFTMGDMGIPSYSAIKSNMEILAFTPMGLEGTTQLFKRFYEMGARF